LARFPIYLASPVMPVQRCRLLTLKLAKAPQWSRTNNPTKRGNEMTREEAFTLCPSDSYVELYGNQWLIVPFAPVAQPQFFICTPGQRTPKHGN